MCEEISTGIGWTQAKEDGMKTEERAACAMLSVCAACPVSFYTAVLIWRAT